MPSSLAERCNYGGMDLSVSADFDISFTPQIRFHIKPGPTSDTASADIEYKILDGEFIDAGSIEWDGLETAVPAQIVYADDEATIAALPEDFREAIRDVVAQILSL